MRIKWWRWWIVPLILTILIGVVPWLVVVIIAQLGLSGFEISFTLFGLLVVWIRGLQLNVGIVLWPYSLVLAWPAALIIHGVWKRRKAKKQGGLSQPGVQSGPKDAM